MCYYSVVLPFVLIPCTIVHGCLVFMHVTKHNNGMVLSKNSIMIHVICRNEITFVIVSMATKTIQVHLRAIQLLRFGFIYKAVHCSEPLAWQRHILFLISGKCSLTEPASHTLPVADCVITGCRGKQDVNCRCTDWIKCSFA